MAKQPNKYSFTSSDNAKLLLDYFESNGFKVTDIVNQAIEKHYKEYIKKATEYNSEMARIRNELGIKEFKQVVAKDFNIDDLIPATADEMKFNANEVIYLSKSNLTAKLSESDVKNFDEWVARNKIQTRYNATNYVSGTETSTKQYAFKLKAIGESQEPKPIEQQSE